jgi:UDP-2,4-diacetamido-2,4,6-trideoxy-beta-L-altropyranose hydrolase
LRPVFFSKIELNSNDSTIQKILVSMGGADVHNISGKVMSALSSMEEIKKVYVLVGKVNQHNYDLPKDSKFEIKNNLSSVEICNLLRECQLAICPASTTAIEACAIGIGILSGYTAENQMDILKGLEKNNCIINMGNLLDVSENEIIENITGLFKSKNQLNSMKIAQSNIIDGKSPNRFLELFNKLSDA